MMLKEKIKAFVKEHRDEIVANLMDIIKIPSVSTDKGSCYKMLLAVKELYEKHGFHVTEGDEYLIAHYGEGKEEIGLFAHGDVVDGGEGWLLTDNPFEPIIYDGAIVGRGAWDDKCAIACSLYTLIALRELNIPLNKRIVCFTGFNEENGMSDIIKYRKTNTPPDFSFVLDAGFPVYYGDKGKAWVRATSKKPLKQIIGFSGGRMINITLGNAEARIKNKSGLYEYIAETDRIKKSLDVDEIVINATGVSAHGANPEGTINGAYLIAEALKNISLLDKGDREILSALSHVLSSPYGETVGIANNDSVFGRLTATNGIVELLENKLSFTLDLRFGKSAKMEEMLKKLEAALDRLGFNLEIISADDAYAIDTENKYLKQYLEAYKSYTGDMDSSMHINAGSTYARHIGNACEIGTRYRGNWLSLPKGHGGAHQPDENIDIEGLLNAMEIIIYAVARIGMQAGEQSFNM